MRLSWLVLAFAIIAVGWVQGETPATSTADPSVIIDATTTVPAESGGDGSSTAAVSDGTLPTEADVTKGPSEAPFTGETEAPVTEAPEITETDDGITGKTGQPTVPTKTTTKAAPSTSKGSTTTKEPQPDVESFTVHCDKKTEICTYSMQVPGLDIDTFNALMLATNETETEVLGFEDSDLVDLESGVTKVFDDAKATVDYVEDQLELIKTEILELETQSATLSSDINLLKKAVNDANGNLNKILAKKGSCLYRQCVLKETTTTRPATTTTVRTTPTPFCLREGNNGIGDDAICKNEGTCNSWYDSYYCTCKGNLDGQDNDCKTSVCDVIKDPQPPGLIYSPGYNGTHETFADDDCDGAQWTVKAKDDKNNVLTLVETNDDFKTTGSDYISKLSPDANLQLTVNKYKLKITSKTKNSQIAQILEYGPTATISYSGPKEDYFHFTITEKKNPVTPAPTPKSS